MLKQTYLIEYLWFKSNLNSWELKILEFTGIWSEILEFQKVRKWREIAIFALQREKTENFIETKIIADGNLGTDYIRNFRAAYNYG